MKNLIHFRICLPFIIPFIPLFFVACDEVIVKGEGDLTTEIRDEKDFHALDISVPGKVEVFRGDTFKVEIQAEASLLPYLETKVRNGHLDIYFSRPVRDVDNLLITITAPDLDGFDLSGSAQLIAFDSILCTTLDLNISGSGDIDLKKIDCTTVDADISGSGQLRLKGTAVGLEFDLSGSGDVQALDCPATNADIQISGSGTVRCKVSDLLKARISGNGDVFYEGSPTLDVDVSGSGRVKKL